MQLNKSTIFNTQSRINDFVKTLHPNEALPTKLKKEAKKLLEEMLANLGKEKSKKSSIKKRHSAV